MTRLRQILASLALILSGLALPVQADTPIFYARDTAAISGYDTVAYFTVGEPVQGQPNITVMWKGVIWHFANLAHREAFEANPRAYAPQYGGYCAYAVSLGHRDSTQPEAWHIVNGKLYLIHNPMVHRLWTRDINGNIAKANGNWPDVLSE